jgi:XTP/dITP diphosphohydrolase
VKFVLATANAGKAREIAAVLGEVGLDIELVPRPTDVPEVEETGITFEDNARLKAVALCEATGLPAIADDSGLVVDALGGAPGVHSARFSGDDSNDARNVAKLIEELRDVAPDRRTARFATVALAHFPDGREVAAFGEVAGTIVGEPRGGGGFGYDPVFVPDEGDGRTFGEMAPQDKNSLSHRGRAFRTLADGLRVVERLERPEEEEQEPN